MNFRKAKVSKAGWFVAPALGLLLGPAPGPAPWSPEAAATSAEMAFAALPPVMEVPLAGLADLDRQARSRSTCANPRRELRFEMLPASAPYPPPQRNAVVCLAVYRPRSSWR